MIKNLIEWKKSDIHFNCVFLTFFSLSFYHFYLFIISETSIYDKNYGIFSCDWFNGEIKMCCEFERSEKLVKVIKISLDFHNISHF